MLTAITLNDTTTLWVHAVTRVGVWQSLPIWQKSYANLRQILCKASQKPNQAPARQALLAGRQQDHYGHIHNEEPQTQLAGMLVQLVCIRHQYVNRLTIRDQTGLCNWAHSIHMKSCFEPVSCNITLLIHLIILAKNIQKPKCEKKMEEASDVCWCSKKGWVRFRTIVFQCAWRILDRPWKRIQGSPGQSNHEALCNEQLASVVPRKQNRFRQMYS